MKHYLIDASSFIILIKKANAQATIECLQDSMVLDLTWYEMGNAIWKESVLAKFLTHNESTAIGNAAQTILSKTERLTSETGIFQKILEIAKTEKLSFYDSSYVYFAKERGLTLVTEDKELKAKARKYVTVQTITALLS